MPWVKNLSKNDLNSIKAIGRKIRPSEFQKLLNSIREVGVIEPVILQKNTTGYTVVSGNQRICAAKELITEGVLMKNIKIQAVIAEKNTPLQTIACMTAVTNILRWNLNIYDQAKIVAGLAAKGGVEKTMKVVGFSRRSVFNMITIQKFIVDVNKQKSMEELRSANLKVGILVKISAEYQAKKKAAKKANKFLPKDTILKLILKYKSEKKPSLKKNLSVNKNSFKKKLRLHFNSRQVSQILESLENSIEKYDVPQIKKSA